MAAAMVASPNTSPHLEKGLLEVTIRLGPLVAFRHQLEEEVCRLSFEGYVADLIYYYERDPC